MLIILLLHHAKKEKKKITIKTVMHRGFSIQNCTFSALFNRVPNFYLTSTFFFLLYVILKLKSHDK